MALRRGSSIVHSWQPFAAAAALFGTYFGLSCVCVQPFATLRCYTGGECGWDGIIEDSHSPWSSLIVLVLKPDRSLHLCNNIRLLNHVSQFDIYPLPWVDDLVELLGRARDLTKVTYWQVALAPDARSKNFSATSGHWQYWFRPSGSHRAPATFQRLMEIILQPHHPYTTAYLDDVVIHSYTWSDLREFLGEFQKAGLTVNPHKCHLVHDASNFYPFITTFNTVHETR